MQYPVVYNTSFNIHVTYSAQPRGCKGMRQVFTFASGRVVEYCGGEHATPAQVIQTGGIGDETMTRA